jgi:uncharacterized protein YjeT (DUF2065 family)
MLNDLLTALALLLVLEGITPFLSPDAMRRIMVFASTLDNATLRFAGLTSMCIGVVLLYIVH